MNLDNIDKALHDLGMLSAITEARREYLREREYRRDTKTNANMMRLNSRYKPLSDVRLVGYCMKRAATKNRLCPYVQPMRHRTKSENSDAISADAGDATFEFQSSMYEPSTSSCVHEPLDIKCPAKRCQSLENLNLAVEPSPAPEPSPEMDCVSTRIQKLQVDE